MTVMVVGTTASKFVAKTVDGKLKFSGGKNSKVDDAPSQGKSQKPAEPTAKKAAGNLLLMRLLLQSHRAKRMYPRRVIRRRVM